MRRLGILLFALALFAQPAAAAQSPLVASLQNELSMLVTSKSADVGIAAIDLSTGETVSVRGNRQYPMASTVKLAVAATYLSYVEKGDRSLDDAISGVSAATLMRRMLVHSDNHATDLLIRNLGGPDTVQTWLDWHKVEGIRVEAGWAVHAVVRPSSGRFRSSCEPSATSTTNAIRRRRSHSRPS